MGIAVVLIPIGYLVGMFQSAEVVGRFVGRDPRREGSRNPGASNMYRISGRNAGAITLVLDVLKGALPAAAGLLIDGPGLGLAAGAAAVVGHIFPIVRGLRGGKGVATFGGVTLVVFPLCALIGLASWAVVVKLSRRASIGSLAGVVVTTGCLIVSGAELWAVLGVAALSALIVVRHQENLRRLLRGDEAPVA